MRKSDCKPGLAVVYRPRAGHTRLGYVQWCGDMQASVAFTDGLQGMRGQRCAYSQLEPLPIEVGNGAQSEQSVRPDL